MRHMLCLAGLALLCAAGASAREGLLGMERIEPVLPFYCADSNRVRDPRPGDRFPPMRMLLGRDRFWAQDGHLEVVVQLAPPATGIPGSELQVTLSGEDGRTLSRDVIAPPAERFALYPRIPDPLLHGGPGRIELAWVKGELVLAEEGRDFRVERYPATAPEGGSIALHIPNSTAARGAGCPVTAGVPFPRGVLQDTDALRLVEVGEEGRMPIPLQVRDVARWSRFGSIKWVHIDFTVDLEGSPVALELEYGPGARRRESAGMAMEERPGFPAIDAGRLRLGDGLWFDATGEGGWVRVLEEAGLRGAFVEHEDGRIYRMPGGAAWEREETGAEKMVLRQEGGYADAAGETEFCRYVTRIIVHRNSPFLRIFHTWIFTGDGNRDRIRNMGWGFPLADGFGSGGFLTDFGPGGRWEPADRLLQYDYRAFETVSGDRRVEHPEGRAPGVAAVEGPGVRLYFGARDFWQNYPSELEFRDGAFWFHNWPRNNRPARYSYDTDMLSRSEWKVNAVRLLFAHQGEMLDFRLPDAFAAGPIFERVTPSVGERPWFENDPESANAQGISRTEEMWLYLVADPADDGNAARLLEGVNRETLRAVVDPAWVAGSGAFYEIHPRDPVNFPEEERVFDLVARSPGRVIERLGLYGMWIHGDIAAWDPSLDRLEPALYRSFRKGHHGWPYSWVPFARSGDPELLRLADAATRQMIDANWCHYADEEVERSVGPEKFRRVGHWHRTLVPWASTRPAPTTRHYEEKSNYLWHAWYLTGYHRALDNVRSWADQTRREDDLAGRGPIANHRSSITLLKSYIETYEATFDPWFLVAAHALAEGHLDGYRRGHWNGHPWDTGDREFLRFTGREGGFLEYFLSFVDHINNDRDWSVWARAGGPVIGHNVHAWRLTGEPFYLGRTAAALDFGTWSVFDGDEPAYYRGYPASDAGGGSYTIFLGWRLQHFAEALAAVHEAGQPPMHVPFHFVQQADGVEGLEGRHSRYRSPTIAVEKSEGEPLSIRLAMAARRARARADERVEYRVTGPGGDAIGAGSFARNEEYNFEIPGEAPAGVYRVEAECVSRWNPQSFHTGMPGLLLPISPPGVREVIELEPGAWMGRSAFESQYTFFVPGDVERFHIEFRAEPEFHALRRMSIWDPDGRRAWNHVFATPGGEYRGESPIRAEIEVGPGQAGRAWRLTLPGRNAGFRMDPQIPPFYAVAPDRWFTP